jgi:penicillin-binding protein 2
MNPYKKQPNTKVRFNIITFVIYLIGIVLLLRLFSLQIINGATYRETSNTRLTRESTIYASRGNITDSSGNLLATVDVGYNLELYKTNLEDEELNQTLLNIINTLEENGDTYTDTFPININPFEYTISGDKLAKWKTTYKLSEDATAEEAFYYFKDKYEITTDNVSEIRKIITIRYRISTEGYSQTRSITIAENISEKSLSMFSEQNAIYGGINIVTTANRTYPNGNLASHILGYIGKISESEYATLKSSGYTINDYTGKTGVEKLFEKYLKGTNGVKQIDMDVDGTVTQEYTEEEAVQGDTLVLTIDSNLQKVTENALIDTINNIKSGSYGKSYDATKGAIVVMNVKNGEVLAMASYPDYNPNDISSGKGIGDGDLFNRAISGAYAPGSTFKMLTAITALQEGKIGITEKINDSGPYPRGHHPACWLYNQSKKTHGYLNVTDALKQSCNFFFYESGYRAGIEQLDRYAKYFGLGVRTGIELPSESAGILASPEVSESKNETWSVGYTLNAAIGQGDNSFTPIQMARYISTLVNGGERISPTIIRSIKSIDGTEISKSEIQSYSKEILGYEDEEIENLEISQEYIDVILEGMKDVTSESGGTAYKIFKNFNITIGGKTGSAQTSSVTNAWFVGFAPYDDPEIAIAVVIEGGGTGSYAAYAARDVIAQYFGMNQESIQEDVTASAYTEQQN